MADNITQAEAQDNARIVTAAESYGYKAAAEQMRREEPSAGDLAVQRAEKRVRLAEDAAALGAKLEQASREAGLENETKTLEKINRNHEKVTERWKKDRYAAQNQKRLADIGLNVPEEMKALPNWCPYKTYRDKETGETNKYVLNVKDGKWARHNDPSTWADFDNAMDFAKRHNCAGLSFAVKGSGLNIIDLDDCIDNGVKSPLAERMTDPLKDTYTERSVSGTGLHMVLKDNVLDGGKFKNRANMDNGGIEVFETWGFVSMTGDMISKDNALTACPAELKQELRSALGEKAPASKKPSYINSESDKEVIERVRRSKKASDFDALYSGQSKFFKLGGEPDNSRNDFALLNILAFFTNCDAGQMERVFKSSGLYREGKEAYLKHSIGSAIDKLSVRPQNLGAAAKINGKGGK
jgi:primase-polymerase (primpol)-like protein